MLVKIKTGGKVELETLQFQDTQDTRVTYYLHGAAAEIKLFLFVCFFVVFFKTWYASNYGHKKHTSDNTIIKNARMFIPHTCRAEPEQSQKLFVCGNAFGDECMKW